MSNRNLHILRGEISGTVKAPRRNKIYNGIPVKVDDSLDDNTILIFNGSAWDNISSEFGFPGQLCPRCSERHPESEFKNDYICFECRYGF